VAVAFAVGLFVAPSHLHATPTIAVTAPAPGQPLYTVQPTLAVAYASDDPNAPLDLDSLRILVNGVDWTEHFSKGPTSATYTVTTADALVAGSLTIAASLLDTAGVAASVSQAYEVFPTLGALVPDTGEVGDSITVGALGLDSEPSRNRMLLKPDGIAAAFEAVDLVDGQGRFIIPPGTRSGPVSLEVNGKRSGEALPFTVPAVVPNCGEIRNLVAMADGSWAVAYSSYVSREQVDPRCPPAEPTTVYPSYRWRVVRVLPNGDVVGVRTSARNAIGHWGVRMVVDKAREKIAVVTRNDQLPVHVYYDGRVTDLSGWVYNADFDAGGNLYVAFYAGGFGIWRVSKESLAAGGNAVLEPVIAELPLAFGSFREQGFAVSCDGFAVVAIDTELPAYPWVQPRLFRIHLASGTIVGDLLFGAGESMENLALSSDPSEIWGMRWLNIQEDRSAEIWRAAVTATGLGAPASIVFLPSVAWPFGVSIGASGNLYLYTGTTAVLAKRNGVPPGPGAPDALPICARQASIGILPSTTRWKPQRDVTTPIEVFFTGASDLTGATLEITDPNGALVTNPTLAFEAIPGTDPPQYKITWSGPWTTTVGGASVPLPRGNYKVVVQGTRHDGSILTSAPYEKVSLVEVKKIEFRAVAGGAPLDGNPGTGSGTRIFAEAQEAPTPANQNPDALDKVTLIATIEPPISDPGEQGPISVHFRSLDVDDPSANSAPVDDESRPCPPAGCDNLGSPQAGSLSDGGTWLDGSVGVQIPTLGPEATALFQTSMRQGDNYRVAASTSTEWLNGLGPVVTSQAGAVTHVSGEPLVAGVQVTEMLTVWRSLHLEVDAFASQDPAADQAAMDLRGQQFTMVTRDRLIDHSGPFFAADHPNPDDWAGASLSLSFHANDWYDVTGNQRTQVRVRIGQNQPPLHNNLRPPDLMALPDKSWILRDDEIFSLDASRSCGPTTCAADYSLARELLARAYIKLDPIVQAPADVSVPFAVATDRNITSNFSIPNQTASSRTYWATQAASAFDGDPAGDLDPRPSTGAFTINLGLTTVGAPLNDGRHKLKSTVFIETIRDLYEKPPQGTVGGVSLVLSPEVNKRVTAHEILHTFGLIHDAAIMCSQINIQNNTVGGTVTNDQIQQLRGVERPVPASHNLPCP
jgi:hypothetical protein